MEDGACCAFYGRPRNDCGQPDTCRTGGADGQAVESEGAAHGFAGAHQPYRRGGKLRVIGVERVVEPHDASPSTILGYSHSFQPMPQPRIHCLQSTKFMRPSRRFISVMKVLDATSLLVATRFPAVCAS